MNPKEWAEKLNGREYSKEIDENEKKIAAFDGIVIAFGYSDDVVIFRGFLNEEFDAYDGATVYISKTGFFENECEDELCPYFQTQLETGVEISARWCPEDHPEYSWWIDAPFPHEPFDIIIIMEGDKKYCRGIVFRLEDVDLTNDGSV